MLQFLALLVAFWLERVVVVYNPFVLNLKFLLDHHNVCMVLIQLAIYVSRTHAIFILWIVFVATGRQQLLTYEIQTLCYKVT